MAQDVERAAAARDAALIRIRRATAAIAVAAVGATAVFASLAAASTHLRKVVAVRRRTAHVHPRRPVRAPAPPLVGVRSAPASAPAPAPAPVVTPQPPVVVSGGS